MGAHRDNRFADDAPGPRIREFAGNGPNQFIRGDEPMKIKSTTLRAASIAALALGGALPQAAQAQDMQSPWKWEATIYGWFPAIGGSTSFPPNGGGPSIDVSTQQVIDALKMAFMGSLEAKNGQWGLWTDLVYANFGASKSGTRDFTVGHLPVSVSADLQLDVKSWIWTLAGTYNLVATPEYTSDLLFGARMLDMQQDLGWTLSTSIPQLPGRTGSGSVSINDWNAVIGVKGRYNFGEGRKWFVPYYVDIGAGESKLTWQAQAGLGYQFGWGSVVATYRYLDYQFKSGSKIESMYLSGPTIGVAFQW
jgi:hypothetical protein